MARRRMRGSLISHTAASRAPRRTVSFRALTVKNRRPISSTPNSRVNSSMPMMANSTTYTPRICLAFITRPS
ncbi:hypothetical protein FQZ97_1246890 [compost metagenome]